MRLTGTVLPRDELDARHPLLYTKHPTERGNFRTDGRLKHIHGEQARQGLGRPLANDCGTFKTVKARFS